MHTCAYWKNRRFVSLIDMIGDMNDDTTDDIIDDITFDTTDGTIG